MCLFNRHGLIRNKEDPDGTNIGIRASEVRIKPGVQFVFHKGDHRSATICKKQNRKHQREEQLGSGNQVSITIQGIVPKKRNRDD